MNHLGVTPTPTPSRKEKRDWDGGGRTGAPMRSRFVKLGFWFLRSCIAALRSSISSTLISISTIINFLLLLIIINRSYSLKDDEAYWINLQKKTKQITKCTKKTKTKNYFLFNKDMYNCFSISIGSVVGLGNVDASSPINITGC